MKQVVTVAASGIMCITIAVACQRSNSPENARTQYAETGEAVEQMIGISVKPNCVISWDSSEDKRIVEYRLTLQGTQHGKTFDKTMHKVKAPATQVSCKDVGATGPGEWLTTVQACLKDGTCSESSAPIHFKVANE